MYIEGEGKGGGGVVASSGSLGYFSGVKEIFRSSLRPCMIDWSSCI